MSDPVYNNTSCEYESQTIKQYDKHKEKSIHPESYFQYAIFEHIFTIKT